MKASTPIVATALECVGISASHAKLELVSNELALMPHLSTDFRLS